jgi:diguanylate cyclase
MGTILKDFPKGTIIFRQGDAGDFAYIIESGRIQISIDRDGEEFPLNVLGEGEFFGEMAILDQLPRSATAKVLEPCRLCVVSREALVDRIDHADPIVRLLISLFIRRTRKMNQDLAKASPDPFPHISLSDSDVVRAGREAVNQMRFESDVKSAFDNREFEMHYQPIVNLLDESVVGFEALIRWQSPTLGTVLPDRFMNVVETSSLMVPVGRWILEQAIADLSNLQAQYKQPLFMSINVSPRQFIDPHFVHHLELTRSSHGLRSDRIKLEITERVLLQGATAIGLVEKCRALGYHISLDDFGTGYSSISYLRDINLDVLKIDQSFIRHLGTDKRARSITAATISLAHALGLECVAEGIESEAIARMLLSLGCTLGQGYHFGRPQALGHYVAQPKAKSKAA